MPKAPHNFSDVDLLLVTAKAGHLVITQRRAKQLAADSFPPIDVVFPTIEEYENPALFRSANYRAAGLLVDSW
jgi:hypothetical protein